MKLNISILSLALSACSAWAATITGTFHDNSHLALRGDIYFTPGSNPDVQDGALIAGATKSARLSNGALSIQLVQGVYTAKLNQLTWTVTVPAGNGTNDIAEISTGLNGWYVVTGGVLQSQLVTASNALAAATQPLSPALSRLAGIGLGVRGDLLIRNVTGWTNLPAASDGKVLKMANGEPAWGTDLTGEGGEGGAGIWGSITGILEDQTDLMDALDLKATISQLNTASNVVRSASQPLSANLTTWGGIAPSEKADTTHQHSGSDLTSGTVPTSRLPANSSSSAGVVASGAGQDSKVWKTDEAGVPGWRDDGGGGSWGSISGTLSSQTDLQSALDLKATMTQLNTASNAVKTASQPAAANLSDWANLATSDKANASHTHAGTEIASGTVSASRLPANSDSSAGIVASGAGQSSKVWGTDENGVPNWRIPLVAGNWSAVGTTNSSLEGNAYTLTTTATNGFTSGGDFLLLHWGNFIGGGPISGLTFNQTTLTTGSGFRAKSLYSSNDVAGASFTLNNVTRTAWPAMSFPLSVKPTMVPASGFARMDSGENVFRVLYAPSEAAIWQFMLPANYKSGLKVDVVWKMQSATSGDVGWSVEVWATSPGDAGDMNTPSFDTANTATTTVPGVAGRLGTTSITCSNADSAAGGDILQFRVTRAADGLTGDAALLGITVSYEIN